MGELINIQGTATAGNANLDYTIPDNKRLQLLYGQITLTTDATVANRYVTLSIYDGSTLVVDYHSGYAQTASQSAYHYELMQGVYRETSVVNGTLQFPIADDLKIQAGWIVRINIENGVAGDSFTSSLVLEELYG